MKIPLRRSTPSKSFNHLKNSPWFFALLPILLLFALLTSQFIAQTPKIPSAQNSASYPVHLAGDPTTSLEKIEITVLLFKPKDVSFDNKINWIPLAEKWYEEAISFWEDVLLDKSKITLTVYPTIIEADANVVNYNFHSIYQEALNKLAKDPSHQNLLNEEEKYRILAINILADDKHFYAQPGQGASFGNHGAFVNIMDTQFEGMQFYNIDSSVKGRAIPAMEAHELGHALGLLHSDEYPEIINKYFINNQWNSNCDLMIGSKYIEFMNRKYVEDGSLQDVSCILPEQQALFF